MAKKILLIILYKKTKAIYAFILPAAKKLLSEKYNILSRLINLYIM